MRIAAPPTPQSPAHRAPRYFLIQELRFVAAFLVVTYHVFYYAKPFPGFEPPIAELATLAFFGVQMFFGISGFVLTHSLQRTSSSQFIAQRLLRIFPPYWFAVTLNIGITLLHYGSYPWSWDLPIALTLLPAGPIAYPLAVEWSLVYEIFFYFVLSLLWMRGSNRILLWSAVIWAALIIISSMAAPRWATQFLISPVQAPFSAFDLAFIAGIFAYYSHRSVSPTLAKLLVPTFPALALAPVLFDSTAWRVLAMAAAIYALLVVVARRALSRDASPDTLLVRFGDWSYGLYLIHVAVIYQIVSVLGADNRAVAWPLRVGIVFSTALAGGLWCGAMEAAGYRVLRLRLNEWWRSRGHPVLPPDTIATTPP